MDLQAEDGTTLLAEDNDPLLDETTAAQTSGCSGSAAGGGAVR